MTSHPITPSDAGEYPEMRALLRKACAQAKIPLPLRLSRLEDWYYAPHSQALPEFLAVQTRLWRRSDGSLSAFCLRSGSTLERIVDPTLEDDEAFHAEMLDWAEAHWAGEEGLIETRACEQNITQRRILARHGYLDEGCIATLRVYDLTRPYPTAALPPGFGFATLAETGARDERIALERAVWKDPTRAEAWFKGKTSSPFYSYDWDLLALSAQRDLAAFVLLWVDWQQHSAEIDPMGTHPDFRHQGIARALVVEAFQRLGAAEVQRLLIESDAGPDSPASRLYASLNPLETHPIHRWVKRI